MDQNMMGFQIPIEDGMHETLGLKSDPTQHYQTIHQNGIG